MPASARNIAFTSMSLASGAVRRRLPISEKRRLVELTLQEGASVRAIAREHGINRHSLYQWRALYAAGKLGGTAPFAGPAFLPVSLSAAPSKARDRLRPVPGLRIKVVLPSGAVVRIESLSADAGFVCALLAQVWR
jgi:transposase-like protein